jgi:hypothetical protein
MVQAPPGNYSGKPRVLSTNAGLVVGAFGNICVVVWSAVPTPRTVDGLGSEYARMRSECVKFGTIVIVEDGVGLPDDLARKGLASLMDSFKASMLCMGGVQEATGFRGAAIRSAITAIHMLSEAPFPRTVTATVEECCSWIVSHCPARISGAPMTSYALVGGIAEIRREAKGKGVRAS